MMRRLAWLVGVLLLGACGDGNPAVDAEGTLRIDQEVIELPRTFVGYPTRAPLTVRNTGRSPLLLELGIEGHFTMDRGRVEVPGGARLDLPVHFAPSAPGTYPGKVIARFSDQRREVEIRASAEPAPPCAPSAPCREAIFDPTDGSCTETVLPDDAPCSTGNLCQTRERCRAGSCIGSAVRCNDDNRCTADACDPARGCVHVDTSDTCPQPTQPCRVGICEPSLGCAVALAPDGTVCGQSDCREARICIDGSCTRVDVPDGVPCLARCGEGRCGGGECNRREGDRLTPLWSYAAPQGSEVLFAGLSDGAGQLYWIERADEAHALVSSTPTGVIRYRAPVEVEGPGERGVLLEGELVLVGGGTDPVVQAFLARDGSSPWRRDLAPRLEGCPCLVRDGALTRLGEGLVLWSGNVASAADDPPRWRGHLARIRVGSGEVDAVDPLGPGVRVGPRPIADEGGNLLLETETDGGRELVALDPGGAPRWRQPLAAGDGPLLAWDGKVLVGAQIRSLVDGVAGPLLERGAGETAGPLPLSGEPGFWTFAEAEDQLVVRTFSPAGTLRRTSWLPEGEQAGMRGWSEAILTRAATSLLATRRLTGEGELVRELVEIDENGLTRRTCEIPADDVRIEGPTSLRSGRWVLPTDTGLRAFELPTADPAARGWVHPAGSPLGGGRPW